MKFMINASKHSKLLFIVILVVFFGAILCGYGLAFDKVVANSADWKDVYSSMLYASLIGKQPGLFLTSAQDGTILLYSIAKSTNGTLIISSKSQPYIVNYKATMDSQGYTDVTEIASNTINIDLAKKLVKENNIQKFIIVDDAYGYNALSVASYAVISNYYVLFANDRNIGIIDSFLSDNKPTSVIIFGQVDEVVKTRLAKYNPETINLGDRFDNNIEMVKRYQEIKHSKQTLMSNGEFIEASIMSGQDPVLFIGKSTVPTQVQDYITKSEFQVAVLIGNELINSATAIRRQIGISVFVKFAQGARNPEGSIASVEDLDKFPMPKYTLSLELYSIIYNKATKALWVTYSNKAGIGAFLKGTITLLVDGQNKGVIGDQDVVFIDKNQYKTITYDLGDIVLDGNNITASVYTLYGEGKRSLENVLQGTMNVETVEILDDATINITDVVYDKGNGKFLITIKNIGKVDSYVTPEIQDLFVNGEYLIVASDGTALIKPGQSHTFPIAVVLSDSDILNNPTVKIWAYYGERENSLIKTLKGEYGLKLVQFDFVLYGLIALIAVLILLIIFGRKKCPNCQTVNSRTRKHCRKCGHKL
jgi:hypothetical protein